MNYLEKFETLSKEDSIKLLTEQLGIRALSEVFTDVKSAKFYHDAAKKAAIKVGELSGKGDVDYLAYAGAKEHYSRAGNYMEEAEEAIRNKDGTSTYAELKAKALKHADIGDKHIANISNNK